MAKQIITSLLDDLDGGPADETVTFAIDGVSYEIDLSAKHAYELREFLGRFQEGGQRLGRHDLGRPAQLRGSTSVRSLAENREHNTRIRNWARSQNIELADRGRIPQRIVDDFHAAQLAVIAPRPKPAPEPEAAPAAAAKPTRRRRTKAAAS